VKGLHETIKIMCRLYHTSSTIFITFPTFHGVFDFVFIIRGNNNISIISKDYMLVTSIIKPFSYILSYLKLIALIYI